ncbi:PLDc N-terminal domain-containing protein [Microcella daejeonensis]|uniref:PLDc N-terminal domain-containing protein n=1 Tax=Microcella daejeonensis TaxID=2994971 RepID=A0A9E8MJC7_9MICO|nr:PLDc N-terminal domain-containing protein [Microcella daejeonensis]WAB80634.1 PLDc N-terminal domain-containing protein [Microcella daejeonensis]
MEALPVFILAAVCGVIVIAFIVVAVLQVVRSTDISLTARTAWVIGIVVAPLIGAMAWYLLGDRTPQIERELGIRGPRSGG